MISSCNNYSINKTNFAINISNNLTILQRKFFNHILFEQENQGWNTQIIRLKIRDINNLIGNNNQHRQNHNKIKSIFKQLLTKELKIVNTKYTGYEATCYISYIKICDEYIEVELNTELKKHLNINYINEQGIKNTSKGYTNLDLNIINGLTSTHDIALYEFSFKTMNEIKHKKEIIVDVNLLREISSCSKSYKQFKEFQRSILTPSIERINQKTNLNIEYRKIIYAGKVESIGLKISLKTKLLPNITSLVNSVIKPVKDVFKQEKTEYPALVLELINIGVVTKKAVEMYSKDEMRLQAIYDEVKTKYSNKDNKEKQKIIVSMFNNGANPGFLTKTEQYEEDKKNKINQRNQEYIEKEEIASKNKMNNLIEQYDNAVVKFKQFTTDVQENILKSFVIKNSFFKDNKSLHSKNYEDKFFSSSLGIFLLQEKLV